MRSRRKEFAGIFASALRLWGAALAFAAFAVSASPALAENGGAQTREWTTYGGDPWSTKYSPLAQIDRENFGTLKLAWSWTSADADIAEDVAKTNRRASYRSLKATPLMAGGILYLSTPFYQAAAVDARTGETLWVHDPEGYKIGQPAMSLGFNQRGVAYWTDGKESRILWGTGDGYLICVDAKTGLPIETFGSGGRVDLTTGLHNSERTPLDHRGRVAYSVASPPMICRDVVVVPCSISDDPMFKEMPPGHIRGYDVRTGERLWEFHTVPQKGEVGFETWDDGAWEYSGNTNVWSQISADDELGYFYFPVGTPTNDFYGGHRLGDNLFAESLLCIDAKTGKRVWHFQMVHHGLWDYDNPCAPNLLDITVDGKKIKAVAQVTKQGFTYVFDRVTGEPVWPIEERPVPQTDVPGERTSPTQPHPTKPPPFESQGVTIDDLIDFTPQLRAEAEAIVKSYRIGPLFTPPSLVTEARKGTIVNPGWGGGANWTGAAVDPETGILYVPSGTGPIVPEIMTPPDPTKANLRYVRKTIGGVRGPQGLPLLKPPYSRLTAIDMNKGEILWQFATGRGGEETRNHPALKGLDLPPLGGRGRGAPLVTKTLLMAPLRGNPKSADADGRPLLAAYDKLTGETVGQVELAENVIGAPMTYMLDGRQYLAFTLASDPPQLAAYALPE